MSWTVVLPVTDDVAVLSLGPGELVRRGDPGHGDEGLEQQPHPVVHGVRYFYLKEMFILLNAKLILYKDVEKSKCLTGTLN